MRVDIDSWADRGFILIFLIVSGAHARQWTTTTSRIPAAIAFPRKASRKQGTILHAKLSLYRFLPVFLIQVS